MWLDEICEGVVGVIPHIAMLIFCGFGLWTAIVGLSCKLKHENAEAWLVLGLIFSMVTFIFALATL